MKITYLFFLITISSFFCFSQQSEKTLKIEKYLDNLQNYRDEGYSKFTALDEKELNRLIKIVYEAIEIGSSEILRTTRDDIPYRNAQSALLRVVQKRYSYFIETFIRVPIFVKAKILSSREVNKGGFRQLNLRLKPEYIVKGKEPFLNLPEFEVFYREYENVPEIKDFKIGKSYLFPLWDRGEPENDEFAIATWVDHRGSRFLIENNILYDEYNFFYMGKEVMWDVFLRNINETINRILNEQELDIYKMPIDQRRKN